MLAVFLLFIIIIPFFVADHVRQQNTAAASRRSERGTMSVLSDLLRHEPAPAAAGSAGRDGCRLSAVRALLQHAPLDRTLDALCTELRSVLCDRDAATLRDVHQHEEGTVFGVGCYLLYHYCTFLLDCMPNFFFFKACDLIFVIHYLYICAISITFV